MSLVEMFGERGIIVSAVMNRALIHRFVDEVHSGAEIEAVDEFCSPSSLTTARAGVRLDREGAL